MSTLSQFVGGNLPIGSMQFMPDVGWHALLADTSEWLRTNTLISKSGYAAAAALEHMRAHLFTATAASAPQSSVCLATNGSGTYVSVDGSTVRGVQYSTDYGQTWTAVSTATVAANIYNYVIYVVGIGFIIGGNSTGNIYTQISADGITYGSQNNTAITGTSAANTVRLAYNGTLVIAANYDTTAAGVRMYSSPTGAAFTSRGITVNNTAFTLSAGPTGLVLVTTAGVASGVPYVSTDGITYTNYAPGILTVYAGGVLGGVGCIVGLTSSNVSVYATTTGGAFGAPKPFGFMAGLPANAGNNNLNNYASVVGNRLVIPTTSGMAYTSDFVRWVTQDTSLGMYDASSGYVFASDARGFVAVSTTNAGVSAYYASSTIDNSNAIGRGIITASGVSGGGGPAGSIGYLRIK